MGSPDKQQRERDRKRHERQRERQGDRRPVKQLLKYTVTHPPISDDDTQEASQ